MSRNIADWYEHLTHRNSWMGSEDLDFKEFVASMPENHWSKYDLSAVRLGWEAYKALMDYKTCPKN